MLRKLFKKTPLAWRQLMKEKVRLAIAIGGIAFAETVNSVKVDN